MPLWALTVDEKARALASPNSDLSFLLAKEDVPLDTQAQLYFMP